MHKTLLGLYHSVLYTKNETALSILGNAADWYLDWTADMQDKNPHVVYSGEEGGMLEVWAGLYEITNDERFFTLAERYAHPSIFKNLQTVMTRFQTAMQMQVFRGRTERQKCMRLQGMRNGFRW